MKFSKGIQPDIRKISTMAMVLNILTLLSVIVLIFTIVIGKSEEISSFFKHKSEYVVLILVIFLVLGNGLSSIWISMELRKTAGKFSGASETLENLETLNNTLRSQRHDFLNNLQVIYGLIEIGEFNDAGDYIEKLYKDICKISRIMKTDSPAINALLQAKLKKCEENEIDMKIDITSTFNDDMPMPHWLVCRILANLIDNAIDAVKEGVCRDEIDGTPSIFVHLTEDMQNHYLEISDNAPHIPKELADKIFDAGFTTKIDKGTGMGLAICKELLSDYNGVISLIQDEARKEFNIKIPKSTLQASN